MQIELSKIQPTAQPVRTTQDEAKIVELVESIREYGLLQAIEVRPVKDKYEIVFGNRRVEACRRLGHTLIRAEIRDLNDSTALIHGLIENVVRENLSAMDKSDALKALQDETGWSTRQMAAQGFMSQSRIVELLKLQQESKEVKQMLTRSPAGDRTPITLSSITAHHVEQVRKEQLPEEQHVAVLQKAAKEGLTAQQARVEARILKTYGTEDEILADAQRYIEQEKRDKEKSRWNYLADSPCAKNFIRHIKVNKHHWKRAWQDIERGALGIEHMPYIEERLRKYAEFIIGLADDLKKRREESIDG